MASAEPIAPATLPRLLRLGLALLIVSAIWLVLLPLASRAPAVASHMENLDEHNVDASAMYYTELDMMKPIFQRLALQERP